ncbi:hypothetical protein KSP39_PZI016458 [Platanthera zijinensis]|uniref:Uncharacterized protein n=1 Tax=Platanthera zijinensis TaxID=2320716 RepID=A0AAP0B6T6_9ASPA
MNFRRGAKVWAEDKDLAWVEAEVVDVRDKLIAVVRAQGKKVPVLLDKLLPRDPDAEHGGVDDMTKLTYLNEPGVLYNLAKRYALNEIYTYTGSILIAVNPFTKIPHLYNVHMMEQYKGIRLGELSPHVFAVADASYRAMMSEGRSQSILVSGESGAGKTETTKLIMQYLTHVGGRAAFDNRTVEQQVLESNPLLEAFGNARTVRNDNSDAERFKVGHPSTFHYLNQSKTYELDGISSAEEYSKTRRAMDIVGISLDDQEAIFRTLAGILHLGNIEFSPGNEHDSSTIKDPNSVFHLQMAAELFMCDPDLLLATLSTRSILTREGSIIKALDTSAAAAGRDALAKTLYAELFDWLVENINKSVGQDMDSKLQIGVLDIYGFECFKNNSFEQFCINFANEKLQQHFNEHVFKMEQEEYKSEEISWSYIEFIDNQDVLDLIEKKPIGIISLLDEACMFPKATNESFATKLFQNFPNHSRLEKPKFSETDFAIAHYAGKVTYQTDSFLDKNRDYVIVEHRSLLSSSKCHFISGLFASSPEESSRSSYKFSSVASRFKLQLQALMETLNSTEPHYVRCVKPNSLNRPQNFENLSVLHQLRCGGVLEAVRISLAGYPTRRTYSEFLDRFGILTLEHMDGSYNEKMLAEKIIWKLNLENFQLGRTKIFLRAGQIAILDGRRNEVLDGAARYIQDWFHTYITRKEFIKKKYAAVTLEAYCRGCLVRSFYAFKRRDVAALSIQTHARSWLSQQIFRRLCSAARIIQSSIRGFIIRQRVACMKERKAAVFIQACWRMWKKYALFQHRRRAAISIQCAWKQKLAIVELRKLRMAANEAGSLRDAKTKLEQRLEDLSLRLTIERRLRVQEHHEVLLGCINGTLGFKDGKPIAASVLYRCLLQWRTFEAERTTIFDSVIDAINNVLKERENADILLYWLSNASALLCLLQRNLRSNVSLKTPNYRSGGSFGLSGRMAWVMKSPLKLTGAEVGISPVNANYPAILFKQQLASCLEKIFGLIRDNLKRELSPLLCQCIQAPRSTRPSAGRISRSPGVSQQPLNTHWESIIEFFNTLLAQLRKNYVPSFFIRKLITQLFSFINTQLFNSLLLRRECCTFSNGEYVKSGLAMLEKWIADVTDEFAGTSWHELNYIRQAVGFLVIHQKKKKTLEEIKHDLCPILGVRQIYRICTMYWDDKYGTQSVSDEVVVAMREIFNRDENSISSSFLLDDDMRCVASNS